MASTGLYLVFLYSSFSPLPSFFCLTSSPVLCLFLSLFFHASGFLNPFWCSSLPQFLYFLPLSCLLACSLCCSFPPVFLSLSSKPRPRLCQGSTPLPHNLRAGRGLQGALINSLENACTDWSHSCGWGAFSSDLSLIKPVPEESALGSTFQRPGTARGQDCSVGKPVDLFCSTVPFLNKLCDLGKVT